MVTIHEVAARAGVSTATVSRALNGKSSVDPALAERVRKAARELGYQRNALARGLRRRKTAQWALVIADIQNPFFTAMARGVEDVAQAAGYSLLLCNSDEDRVKERQYLDVAVQDRVAGVILAPTSTETDTSLLVEHEIPVVAIDRPLRHARADTVLVGSREGARAATEHLLASGYQRPGCVTGPAGVQTADERLAGYYDALAAAGVTRPADDDADPWVRRCDFKVAGAHAAGGTLLDGPDRPDALFVASGLMVLGVLQAMRERGLRAGRDVGVVAFDDTPWTQLLDPPLSVIAQPVREVGRAAARLLLDRLRNGQEDRPARTVTLGTRLVVRDSSRRAS